MKKIISKIIHTVFPKKFLAFLFPKKYSDKYYYNRFINVHDEVAKKSFFLYFRRDCLMEAKILEKGLYGGWEKESFKIWANLSQNSNIIFDIGANTGIFSMLAANNNNNANIIAVEPVNLNCELLNMNIEKNKFNIHAEKVAISDKEGIAKMFMLKDQLNYMTSVNDDRYAKHPEIRGNADVVEIEVPIVPFSKIFEKFQLATIDLIKIDVEGHEITVLKGMMSYLKKYKPAILIEVIGDENAQVMNLMFDEIGYSYVAIDEINPSKVVEKLWDNHHHNFLVCMPVHIQLLKKLQLIS